MEISENTLKLIIANAVWDGRMSNTDIHTTVERSMEVLKHAGILKQDTHAGKQEKYSQKNNSRTQE